uniref:Hydroxyacid-oxoacid transhydrogenase, mitochondrial n=1 Tax=Sinocyclocheilus grahami TaxID=75366 RepID=A0A672NR71_SINGR
MFLNQCQSVSIIVSLNIQVLHHNVKDLYAKIIINIIIIVVILFILLVLFQMACSNIRYGAGVTREIDLQNMGARNVCLMTDRTLSQLPPIYEDVRVEPTDKSFKAAIDLAKKGHFDVDVTVGGGSVIDTCKAANLYASHPEAEFLDFANAPIGKGKPITATLKPLIAVPTMAGTVSETTGVAIFDFEDLKAKTGIANQALKPILGMVDPYILFTCHPEWQLSVALMCSGVFLHSHLLLCHNLRSPCPSNPINRPAYQGSNSISDVWARHALKIIAKYLKQAVRDAGDVEARYSMHLASVFAGFGFGNAGVHLCHGMSYPIAGNVKTHRAKGYNVEHPIVPHGLSVVLTSPARHLDAAQILGNSLKAKLKTVSNINTSDTLRSFLYDLEVEDGLSAIGYTKEDIPSLVKGTIPQERVTKQSPRAHTEEDLTALFAASMKLY